MTRFRRSRATNRAFEHVVIVFAFRTGGLRTWNTDHVAEFGQEHLVVGALRATFPRRPSVNKIFDLHAFPRWLARETEFVFNSNRLGRYCSTKDASCLSAAQIPVSLRRPSSACRHLLPV